MVTRLDKFGRIVLPVKIRQRLGLQSGSELVVDVSDDSITLRPPTAEGKLVRERGVLVWTGPGWDQAFDPTAKDRQARDERNRGD